MFIFEPQFVITSLIIGLIVLGPICAVIGKKRKVGPVAGYFLGFLLGIIGLVVVLCSSKIYDHSFNLTDQPSIPDQLKKYKELLDSGAITEYEYNVQKGKLLNQ